MSNETLYLKIEQNILVKEPSIRLEDIAKVECTREDILRQVKQLQIYRFTDSSHHKKQVQTFSVLKIIELIHEKYPQLEINNIGEPDFVIHYAPVEDYKAWQAFKTCFVCAVLFFGAAFMIMTFINDVSVPEVFDKFYTQVTGREAPSVTVLEISFCIGLPLGTLIFYNHLGKQKLTDDPTPVQVAMRKYEQDVDTTYIESSSREGKSIDVD